MLLVAHELRIPSHADGSPLVGPVNFRLDVGERVTITGPSGSGKSTLLRCLAMLDARAIGSIEFRGEEIRGDAVPPFRRDVAFVAQAPPRFSMTVEDSLRHVHAFAHCKRDYDQSAAHNLLEHLRLPRTILKRDLPTVSGGEAQRLSLLRALMLQPSVLLLDEVTSALDDDSAKSVAETLRHWFANGDRAGVAVTHGDSIWGAEETRRVSMESGRTVEDSAT